MKTSKSHYRNNFIYIFFAFAFFTVGCTETLQTPKPRAYPKVVYPVSDSAITFAPEYCNLSFQHPSYINIKKDTFFFDGKPKHDCWFDMELTALNCKIHCSFIPVSKKDPLDDLINDSYELISKHNIKADYINEYLIQKENGVNGVVFDVEGSVASNFQFYLTDSTDHFFRGSLYFNSKVRADSIAPVAEFMKKEIMQIIETFEWK